MIAVKKVQHPSQDINTVVLDFKLLTKVIITCELLEFCDDHDVVAVLQTFEGDIKVLKKNFHIRLSNQDTSDTNSLNFCILFLKFLAHKTTKYDMTVDENSSRFSFGF